MVTTCIQRGNDIMQIWISFICPSISFAPEPASGLASGCTWLHSTLLYNSAVAIIMSEN